MPSIGIECHVQLSTKSKLFSAAGNDARGAAPNTLISPLCLGLPGTLPVLNGAAVDLAIAAGLALNARIASLSSFDRKHYFYPDLPKGYQITQLDKPIVGAGRLKVPLSDGVFEVGIIRAHLEEDAGKLTHPPGSDISLVDLNRAGTPLLEIVSAPDMHGPAEAKAYAQELYLTMVMARVTDGDLYHGNMRFDVNVSLSADPGKLGVRAEIKNLNSFRSVERAVAYEIKRQQELINAGESLVQQTRGWDEATQTTKEQRTKETATDYRYFPDPDIPPLALAGDRIAAIKKQLPMLPWDYRASWSKLNLDGSVVTALLGRPAYASIVSSIKDEHGEAHARRVAHWLAGLTPPPGDKSNVPEPANFTAADLVELSAMVEEGALSATAAKQVLAALPGSGQSPRQIAEKMNLSQLSDRSALVNELDKLLKEDAAAARALADYQSGNLRAGSYIIGQLMKRTGGKANPALAAELLKRLDR